VNPSRLERAAVALAAKLHEARPHLDNALTIAAVHSCPYKGPTYYRELAALEGALATAPLDREMIEDLPRMIELEKHTAPDSDYTAGWNAALEQAAQLARFVLTKG